MQKCFLVSLPVAVSSFFRKNPRSIAVAGFFLAGGDVAVVGILGARGRGAVQAQHADAPVAAWHSMLASRALAGTELARASTATIRV